MPAFLCAFTPLPPAGALLLGVAQAQAGLVLHYKFDETSGTTAVDSSGNGNTGTLSNMAGNEWATGKVGGGLSFDGTTGGTGPFVRTSLIVDLDDALSLSAWVNVADTTSSTYNIFGAMTSATDYFMILPRVNVAGVTLQHRANPPAGGARPLHPLKISPPTPGFTLRCRRPAAATSRSTKTA